MCRPLHYLLPQPAPVTHKPQHSHESSGPQDHHPSFYLSIPASIHLYTALYNPLCLSWHIPISHTFAKLSTIACMRQDLKERNPWDLYSTSLSIRCSSLTLHIWPLAFPAPARFLSTQSVLTLFISAVPPSTPTRGAVGNTAWKKEGGSGQLLDALVRDRQVRGGKNTWTGLKDNE